MATQTLSVLEALNRLSVAKKRVDRVLNVPAAIVVGPAEKDKAEVFKAKANASYQQATALIQNYRNIKSALVISNAKTMVTIGGKTITVAEAIERKTSIDQFQNLLASLKKSYCDSEILYRRELQKMEDNLTAAINTAAGNAIDVDKYRKNQSPAIVGLDKLDEKIQELEAEIDEFLSQVDIVLTTSNAKTQIEVDLG